MNRKFLAATAIVIGGFLAAGAAWAQDSDGRGANWGAHRGPRAGEFWHNPRIVKALNLSKDQVDRLEAIHIEYVRNMIDLVAAEKKAGLDLHVALRQARPDEKKAKAAADAWLSARRAMMYRNIEKRTAVSAVLTDDQATRLRELGPADRQSGRGPRPDENPEHHPEEDVL